MVEEVTLNGTRYVSSRRAAAESGYSQDYIGQLARDGHVRAQRMTGHWYVYLPSVMQHKEEADEYVPDPPEQEGASGSGSVSFDGKEFVPSKRAAQVTGYTQDYVTQLARGGKVPSRQIGRRWLVSLEDIVAHKKHNDELLAAVQADATGFKQPVAVNTTSSAPKQASQTTEPLRYVQEPSETIPVLHRKEQQASPASAEPSSVPARVHVTDLRQKNVSRVAEISNNPAPKREEKPEQKEHDIAVSRMPAGEAASMRRSFIKEEEMREEIQAVSKRRRVLRIVRNVLLISGISVVLGVAAYVLIGPVRISEVRGFEGFGNALNAIFGGGETYTRGTAGAPQ